MELFKRQFLKRPEGPIYINPVREGWGKIIDFVET